MILWTEYFSSTEKTSDDTLHKRYKPPTKCTNTRVIKHSVKMLDNEHICSMPLLYANILSIYIQLDLFSFIVTVSHPVLTFGVN